MSSSNNGDTANFECNICLDLAQDPIITLCGHLFCWPCLYKWLHIHSNSNLNSNSQQCPVCKSHIQQNKLVPLYGRGKTNPTHDHPSSRSPQIPDRPPGQRPATVPPPPHFGGPPRFALSASIGGLIPNLFNFQMHGFSDAAASGSGYDHHFRRPPRNYYQHYRHYADGNPYGFAHSFHGAPPHDHVQGRPQDSFVPMCFLILGVLVILALISN